MSFFEIVTHRINIINDSLLENIPNEEISIESQLLIRNFLDEFAGSFLYSLYIFFTTKNHGYYEDIEMFNLITKFFPIGLSRDEFNNFIYKIDNRNLKNYFLLITTLSIYVSHPDNN